MFAALSGRRLVLKPEKRAFLGFLPDSVRYFPSTRKGAMALPSPRRHAGDYRRSGVQVRSVKICASESAYSGRTPDTTRQTANDPRPSFFILKIHGVTPAEVEPAVAVEVHWQRRRPEADAEVHDQAGVVILQPLQVPRR